MKYMKIKLLAIAMLFSVAAVNADVTTGGRSVFMPVAMNGTASSNLGWSGSIYQHDSDELRACFKVQLEYGANNKRAEIGKYFSPSSSNVFVVGPENTAGTANDTDWAGVNLLLGNTFKSTVTFLPKAQDLIVDFGMYVDLAEWLDGLYFRSHMPLQNARWEVEISETINTALAATAANVYEVGAATALASLPYADFTAAIKGDKTVDDASVKWSYGRINGKRTETKLGDINLTLGYNFINKEHCHLGVGVTGILGAGGKTTAEYMFQPVIGYAGRFGVGGTLDGGARLWDKDDTHQLVANMTFYAAHLFDNEQRRSYDLTASGDMSRYLLVKKEVSNSYATSGVLDNMINIGSLKAKIGVDVVYNGNLTFCWQMDNVSVDFGYQVAGHGKEKHKEWVDTITADTYTLYDLTSNNVSAADDTVGIDQITISGDESGQTVTATLAAGSAAYIINDDLNKDSGLMKAAVEHTLFAGVNYTWSDNEWMPSVGALGSYHIAGSDNNTFDRWSVGFQFNFCV